MRTVTPDRRTRRFLVSQALRLGSLVAAALLPVPLLARLALLVGCMVLSFGAAMGGDAESARRRRERIAARALAASPRLDAAPHAPAIDDRPWREGLGYRLRWRTSYALLTAYGPAQLSGDDDPRVQMRTERAARRAAAVTVDR